MKITASSPYKTTVAIRTLGCKLNQAESESLARRFTDAGYMLVSASDGPDIFILNTCTVTHIADRKCRQYLREFTKRNPESLVLAVGCYADRDADALSRIEGVDLVVGNADKSGIVQLVQKRIACGAEAMPIPKGSLLRTRPQVVIQQGCSHRCSYCIVPDVRGSERSIPAREVLEEVRQRVSEGFREVVLTGTRIGVYNDRGANLESLLGCILAETDITQIHLSSLQPSEITSGLLDLWQGEQRICRHLHLALQSGSAAVLKRMNRGYSIEQFRQKVQLIRQAMPDVAVTTDIIVGFPGETDAEFEQSYRFCEETGFADMHIFPYSSRPGTPAAKLAGGVADKVKKERSRVMLELTKKSGEVFRARFIGRTMPVLWEEVKKGKLWAGHTGNYIRVITENERNLANRLTDTRLDHEFEGALLGEILGQ